MTAEHFLTIHDELTERECEVLALVAQGKTNAEIADVLGIQFGTARNHVSAILAKLGVATREEAAAWWRRERRRAPLRRLMRGLVPLPLLKVAAGVGAAAVVVAGGVGALAMMADTGPEGATVLLTARPSTPADRPFAEEWLSELAACLSAEGIEVTGPTDTRVGQVLRFTGADALEAWEAHGVCDEALAREAMERGEDVPFPVVAMPFLLVDDDTISGDSRYGGTVGYDRATLEQQAIIADGEVTVAENAAALDRVVPCLREAGLDVDTTRVDPADPDLYFRGRIPDQASFSHDAHDSCMATHYDAVWKLWQVQQ